MIQSPHPRNSGLPLTADAYRRLELELERLRDREEEPIIHARIARLEQVLALAHIVEDRADGHTVAIGSQVTLLDQESGRTETYLIDGAHGSMESNVITAVSPMGALIGRERGAVVHVELPSGRFRTFTIVDVAQPAYA
jgi:transcription elongation GreA/GreB family factor